jgi:glycosyltransferase involved in cell wall biosynthesis
MKPHRTILALAAYPERVASTRFRLTQLIPYLEAHGLDVCFEPFVDGAFLGDFGARGGQLRKAAYLATKVAERIMLAARSREIDAVYIQREAALIGPPFTEFVLRQLRHFPIIFDFDDAIWHHDLARSNHPVAARLLKDPGKCWYTMRAASCVIAGSSYLAKRAREVNPNVEVVPTVVSSKVWTPLPERLDGAICDETRPRIGWVGSHSTAHQLEIAAPALRQLLGEGHRFDIHVVGAAPDFRLEGLELRSRAWSLEDELPEFQNIDIGLAPMGSEAVYEGKCGFKQLQYMAVGVPFVSSLVGGARDFVVDGENGLVAYSTQDWYRHLKALLESRDLRRKLAQNGRRSVETQYCLERQGPRVAQLIEQSLKYGKAS